MIISVPATSANLGPGFDTLGLALDLRNIVKIKKSRFFSISIKGEGANNVRLKGNNLFISIFNEHYRKLVGKTDKFRFTFINKIPLSRGLGSSSAVIVSAIAAAYAMAGVAIPREKLLNLALIYEPHPDNITPAVMGGFNVAVVENNKVYSLKKEIPQSLKAVVVIPNRPISTAHSRTRLPKRFAMSDVVYNVSRSSLLTAAFFSENWEMLRVASMDKLHQDIRMRGLPELFELQKLALQKGALMSTLSGSGSTFFNLCYESKAKELAKVLKDRFAKYQVKILDFDNKGLIIEE
ncbi:homoserine kinase [Nitratiruptor sp. SB155-2]|uniref:Homoserine kinase n=1 Tax=Nitratiruptor sp. (strain SB155-2) TaxID=387092 RepID=KHSE_NITSB|nr:homoserine kinase [Nitratiruptor sp. SB155-2]A6Q225.1 RecName: Full=Homoserine kinase; Short=HK; Short=HSK [Nitratiruptor sp. SB155-2]BAF69534.1 homoserine kinase [Nitratiruptor sp. SB155-2]